MILISAIRLNRRVLQYCGLNRFDGCALLIPVYVALHHSA